VPSAIEQALEGLDLPPQRVIVSEFPSLIEDLCRRGVGVVAMSRAHFAGEQAIKAVRLPPDFPDFVEKLYVTWTRDAENAEVIKNLKPLLPRLE
jgi:hypothetical protein